ncbi:MAG TPA: HAMP domain-containing sensor histidine kinase [Clostridia bacterium]|nr:HAMP domain-containing sensor histidine kinase [Clostridia bacterium]
MDTKSRNIKYSFLVKAFAVFLIWVSFAGMFASVYFFGINSDVLMSENYFQSHAFIAEFNRCVEQAISSADVQKLTGYVSGTGTGNTGTGSTEAIADSSSVTVNFKYVARNIETNAIVTNMELDADSAWKAAKEFPKNKSYLFYSAADNKVASKNFLYADNDNTLYPDSLESLLKNAQVEFFAAVDDQLKQGDSFYDIQQEYKGAQAQLPLFLVIAIAAFALGLCSFIYLASVAGRNEKNSEIMPALIDWFYNDLHIVAVILAATLSLSLLQEITLHDDLTEGIFLFAVLSIDLLIGLSFILSMIRNIKRGTLFQHTMIYRLFKAAARFLAQCFQARTFRPAVLFLLLAYGGVNAILFAIATNGNPGFPLLLLVIINLGALYYVSKTLGSISGIMRWVNEMTKGNLDYALDTGAMSPAFHAFAKDIAGLQTGIKEAVAEAVKGEKLKTELISNVSHDLKTPLTSIINYVDLLKKENPENDTVKEYIGILESKSARLKQLVDDLLEASKAASGDMIVNYGRVDLCSLAQQSVAEYSEKAAETGLDVRVKVCENPVVVHGDGTLMWRIMDNLLSNAMKYSQKNSRVYIDIERNGLSGVITIKNVSEAALDISSDQFLERFVRGDSSRSTEGSGLGLSIAKSLAELQGGTLALKVDGDLFKVIVTLPLEAIAQ